MVSCISAIKESKWLLSCLILLSFQLKAQQVFQPLPEAQCPHLKAIFTSDKITVDGIPDEAAWNKAPVATYFTAAYPRQGAKASYTTEVKLLYDDKNIYVSAKCDFPPGKKSMQVQDLRRDFSFSNNELFEIVIDPFKDPRLPVMTFCTTPYGTKMDIMHYADGSYDYKWDAVWQAASNIQQHAWSTEIAIPFSTLRYPQNSTEWSINFIRNIRHLGEISGWAAWPQAYSESRMEYAGILTDIIPTKSKLNLQIEPYALVNTRSSDLYKTSYKPQAGGEIKYTINPNTVLEASINTDFAQAEVDRQVVNLTRSSVFFPEQRQFFLENSSLFSLGQDGYIQPFFSRRIGLSDNGTPLKIDGGLRLIHQDNKQSLGLLVMKQEGDTTENGAYFGVLRYKKNITKTLQLGGMEIFRGNTSGLGQPASVNPVEAIDMFWRVSQPLYIRSMASYSNYTQNKTSGTAAYAEANYSTNTVSLDLIENTVSKGYVAQSGFTTRQDFINTQLYFNYTIHKNWFPKGLSFIIPQAFAEVYHEASTGKFQEATLHYTPFLFMFKNLSLFNLNIISSWENLVQNFQPVRKISLAPGSYQFNRYELHALTNPSARYSIETRASTGGYYNGKLNSYYLSFRAAPTPYFAFLLNYTRNDFKNTGIDHISTTTHLLDPELRIALNPKILLSGFYQYNTDTQNGSLNARFTWEYKPLSFIYLVINSLNNYYTTPFNVPEKQQGGIIKMTYIRKI